MAQIEYQGRSSHDAVDWECDCGTMNMRVRKLIFDIPQFVCLNPDCHLKYLKKFDYDFCLADVTANSRHLIREFWIKEKNALHIMHGVDVLLKKADLDPMKLNIDPAELFLPYYKKYPRKVDGDAADGHDADGRAASVPNSIHKFISMVMEIKNNGVPLEDGRLHRIGDISTISKDDYEKICEELADGTPLLATFIPGASFGDLEYCRMYYPHDVGDLKACRAKYDHDEDKEHAAHMVVLIGIASRAYGLRGFFFLNSHGELWCPRKVLEEMDLDKIDKRLAVAERTAIKAGIGKIHEVGLYWNVIKLSRYGERAVERQLVELVEDGRKTVQDINYHLILN